MFILFSFPQQQLPQGALCSKVKKLERAQSDVTYEDALGDSGKEELPLNRKSHSPEWG